MIRQFLIAFPTLFFVIDPLGLLPIFTALTASQSAERTRAIALRACLYAFGVLAVFIVSGTLIFRLFGVSLGAFRVAGGMLLMLTALDLLKARPPHLNQPDGIDAKSEHNDTNLALVPLAIPLLAGPGALATVTMLTSKTPTIEYTMTLLVATAATMVTCFVILGAARPIQRALGKTGLSIAERIFGLLLASLAVQFMAEGAFEIYGQMKALAP